MKASTEAKRGQLPSPGLRTSHGLHLLPFCNCGRVGNLLCYSVVYSVSADYRGERSWSVRTMIAAAYWGAIHRQTANGHKGKTKMTVLQLLLVHVCSCTSAQASFQEHCTSHWRQGLSLAWGSSVRPDWPVSPHVYLVLTNYKCACHFYLISGD